MAHLRPNPPTLSLHALLRSTPDNAVVLLLYHVPSLSHNNPTVAVVAPSYAGSMFKIAVADGASSALQMVAWGIGHLHWGSALAACTGRMPFVVARLLSCHSEACRRPEACWQFAREVGHGC